MIAVDAGFWDVDRLRTDDLLAPLREEAPYKDLVRASWAKGYLAMLERPEREDFQQKDEVMRVLAFRPGERVADVGTGSGYFTVPVAKAVGPDGSVLAVDIIPEMLAYVGERTRVEGLTNVRFQKATREDPGLAPGAFDTILVIDTLHYVVDRTAYARKLRVGLAPHGRIVVIDYIPKSMEERPWGPSVEQQFSRETIDARDGRGRHAAERRARLPHGAVHRDLSGGLKGRCGRASVARPLHSACETGGMMEP